MPRIASLFFAVLLCLFASMALAALWQSGMRANTPTNGAAEPQVSQASVHSNEAHPVIIRKPSGPPRIELAGTRSTRSHCERGMLDLSQRSPSQSRKQDCGDTR